MTEKQRNPRRNGEGSGDNSHGQSSKPRRQNPGATAREELRESRYYWTFRRAHPDQDPYSLARARVGARRKGAAA